MSLFDLAHTQNPWWEKREAIEEDYKILQYEEAELKWKPQEILSLPHDSDAVHIVFGPRQIGKSTALKLLIRNFLLKRKVDPTAVFYFNCDAVPNRQALIELVIDYLEFAKEIKGRKYIFLDEISSVEKWAYGIKWLVDSGFGRKVVFYTTGSTSLSWTKSGEYLPGRRGKGKDVTMLPLSFFDFLQLFYPNLQRIKLSEIKKRTPTVIRQQIRRKVADLQNKLAFYWLSGGFPKVINDYYHQQRISLETVGLYQAWIRSALAKADKKEEWVKSIAERVFTSLGSGTSYQAIAQAAGIGSHNTARDYLEFLQETFLLLEAPFFDVNQKRKIWRKNKKFYFVDPFLFWLLYSFYSGTDNLLLLKDKYLSGLEEKGKFVENLVATELYKHKKELLHFANSGEIDFVLPENSVGIEVKYRRKVVPADYPLLKKKMKAGIVISQQDFYQHDNITVLPLEIFLLIDLK